MISAIVYCENDKNSTIDNLYDKIKNKEKNYEELNLIIK